MKVGICTFSDGRRRAMESLRDDCFGFQSRIATFLASEGHEPVEAKDIIWSWSTAKEQAQRLTDEGCDAVIFNFAVWSFPDFTAQAANWIDAPILLMGNINAAYPGWVAFFASCGTLDEIGRPYGRALGDIEDAAVQAKVREWLRLNTPAKRLGGEAVAEALHGQRYGEFDGPSMGMYTTHVDQSQWMQQFGVQVHHRSQLTLAYLSEEVAAARVQAGLDWLEKNCGGIEWDGKMLTPGLDGTLARQVRLYLGIKDFCRDEGIDFLGLTGQLDYTEWPKGCTMDVPEAILNDNVDWEGEKKPLVCATECDSNGALTMQMMHLLTGTPVLFADLRHYHTGLGLYDLCNSGEHAPWFSKRSNDWRENWKEVRLMPALDFYFKGGGASVQFYGAEAEKVTLARITRKNGDFRMHIVTGSFVTLPHDQEEKLGDETNYTWPHIWTKMDCRLDTLATHYAANHIHGCIGDYVGELVSTCEALGIEPIVLAG